LNSIFIETIGWISTGLFLISIVIPQRVQLHMLGVLTAVTTGFYAYEHGATAIWVKWAIAFFFHFYMWYKLSRSAKKLTS
jgi:hypothetical protein